MIYHHDELRRLSAIYASPAGQPQNIDAIVDAREELAEAVPGLLDEIERLRSALAEVEALRSA